MADNHDNNTKKSFKETLNLPRTDFPIRANAKEQDPKMIARWEQEKLFESSFNAHKGAPKYILHDGPPYANGNIHLGHAYNKILKDIVGKSHRMLGYQVPITPGWDCHGLPIELKVTQEQPGLSRKELQKACRKYAQKWIDVQRTQFKNLGILMNWAHPYTTMDYSYESKILHAFGKFVKDNYIERKNKTVPWCASCQTVLASAEIEYADRKDPSIYVLFQAQDNFESIIGKKLDKAVNIVIWTTTPWTLPLNRAVLAKPDAPYVILDINDTYVAVGKELADNLCQNLNTEKKVIAEFMGDKLAGMLLQHPFIENLTVPVILDDSVLTDDGTAFVHCAPGCGPEDYEVGVRNKLEIFAPVGPDGHYTHGVEPAELTGMPVTDGQIWVIKKLHELGKLLYKTSIRHSYPHCWRCREGLIFRATKQWFCDLTQHDLKQRAINAIPHIQMVPQTGTNRLRATLEGRFEWCLSRQRIWGVPIPALLCTQCDYAHTSQELIDQVAQGVAKNGIEFWDDVTVEQILPKEFACPKCAGTEFKKEQDILDVWFESGVSHYAVLRDNPELAFPANVYVEGSDQHRAWFQSSLLTGIVLEEEPPMKTIITHGFTVDERGQKMSKSLGNVVSPDQMIDKLGTDGLRLWAASADTGQGDVAVSDTLIKNVQEVLRKVRNTARFLLSNLYDFDITRDAIALEKLRILDQHALHDLYVFNHTIIKSYMTFDFTAVFHALGEYCARDLSSHYLDIVKDRLYVDAADGHARRSAQTACWYILDTLTRLIAPIMSCNAELLSDLYQKDKVASIHLQMFADLSNIFDKLMRPVLAPINDVEPAAVASIDLKKLAAIQNLTFNTEESDRWRVLYDMREVILKALEEKRASGDIKHSLEACVQLYVDHSAPGAPALHDFYKLLGARGESPQIFFKEFLIVSLFDIVSGQQDIPKTSMQGVYVRVTKVEGSKCPRCWHYEVTDHEHDLCSRCSGIIREFIDQ